jgi:hypothetical protein
MVALEARGVTARTSREKAARRTSQYPVADPTASSFFGLDCALVGICPDSYEEPVFETALLKSAIIRREARV